MLLITIIFSLIIYQIWRLAFRRLEHTCATHEEPENIIEGRHVPVVIPNAEIKLANTKILARQELERNLAKSQPAAAQSNNANIKLEHSVKSDHSSSLQAAEHNIRLSQAAMLDAQEARIAETLTLEADGNIDTWNVACLALPILATTLIQNRKCVLTSATLEIDNTEYKILMGSVALCTLVCILSILESSAIRIETPTIIQDSFANRVLMEYAKEEQHKDNTKPQK